MRLVRTLSVAAALAAVLLLSGCSTSGQTADGAVSVVTGAYPFAYVAEQVGGDHVDVVNLTPPGAEPHDLELSPQQTAKVVDAALLLQLPGFQPAFDEAIAQNADASHVLDIADVVRMQPVAAGADPSEAATTPQGDAADPHVWLDPTNLIALADATAARLAEIDPAHADDYTANAADLTQRLRQLDHEYRTTLSSCAITTIVTNHAAFGYLTHRYGLSQVSISGLDPEIEPSPQQLADVVQAARAANVTTVFAETLVNPAAADALARELGVQVATLNPVEGLTQGSDADYFSIMHENLATLAKANQCSAAPSDGATP